MQYYCCITCYRWRHTVLLLYNVVSPEACSIVTVQWLSITTIMCYSIVTVQCGIIEGIQYCYCTRCYHRHIDQKTIVKAHKTYIGQGWVTYDTCYHRKAANTKCLDWDVIDFNLYNETFAGRTKVVPRCLHCSSEFHFSAECVQAPDYITPTAHLA